MPSFANALANQMTLHVAGPYGDDVQRCSRCGEVILDDRRVDGRIAMTRIGYGPGPRGNSGFKVGSTILVGHGFKTLVADPTAAELPPYCERGLAS